MMFDNIDFSKMGEVLKDFQSKAKEMEAHSRTVQMTARGGGGLVSITFNGAGEVLDVTIDERLMSDRDMLQLQLIGTFNDVIKMLDEHKKSQALGALGGINPFGS